MKATNNFKFKHVRNMDAMNQLPSKANKMESLIGDALGLESGSDTSGLSNDLEDKDKGTKRNAEDEEVEDMKIVIKRPRLWASRENSP
jgi:hypothetical protein